MSEEEKKPAATVVASYTINHYSDNTVKLVSTIGDLNEEAMEQDVRALGLQIDASYKANDEAVKQARIIAQVLDMKTPAIVDAVKKALTADAEKKPGEIKKTPSAKN